MESWVAVGVGAVLIAIGGAFISWHLREWRQEKNDPQLDPADRKHYHARFRRRMQTSTMIIVMGVLIPIGDILLEQGLFAASTIVWFVVFGLIIWVIMMAFGDMVSTRSHTHVAMAKVRQKQRELERQVAEIKNRGGNGRSGDDAANYN